MELKNNNRDEQGLLGEDGPKRLLKISLLFHSLNFQASKQRIPDEVEIVKTVTRELGFANRSALPQKILDFCGSFPIYNVEEIPLGSNNALQRKAQGKKTNYYYCGLNLLLKSIRETLHIGLHIAQKHWVFVLTS